MMTAEHIKTDKVLKYKCQKDLMFFWRWFFKKQYGYKANIASFHHTICEYLHRVARGEITRLVINIPPRYGKTDLAVKAFVAWTIANNPRAKFIHLSYSDELVNDNSSAIKETIESGEYQRLFGTQLKKDTRSKKKWYTQEGGGMYAVASGGAITGFGAGTSNDDEEQLPDEFFSDGSNFGGAIIIDDPLKPDDALSDTSRNKINERYNSTIRSRTNSRRTPVIVIMQRLHEDDMSGFLLGGGSGEEWTHLCVPALNDDNEAIWPFKHTTEELDQMEGAASYMFAGQYMQRPAPVGGGLFKDEYWRFYRPNMLPDLKYQVITADTAQKTREQNDYTVIQCWGVDLFGNNIYMLDMIRGKWEAPELRQQMLAFYAKQQKRMRVRTVFIEDKSSGSSLIQELQRGSSLPVRAVQRGTDKVARAYDIVDFVAAGRVWLPEGGDGVSDLLRESTQFPNGKHDDTLDPLMDAVDQCLALANRPGDAAVSYGSSGGSRYVSGG
jgi:predicted phage terminase large subunit-like protein